MQETLAVSGNSLISPVLPSSLPSTDALKKVSQQCSRLDSSDDPDGSLQQIIGSMTDKKITVHDLGNHLGLSGDELLINIASGVRTAFFRVACDLDESRLRIPSQVNRGYNYEQQIINKQHNNAKRMADTFTKADITIEECGATLPNYAYEMSPGDAYKNWNIGPGAFVFDRKKKLDGSVEFFHKNMRRVYPEERLPDVYKALGLPEPVAPKPAADAAKPVVVSKPAEEPTPAPEKKEVLPIMPSLPDAPVIASEENLLMASRIYKKIELAEDPDILLRKLLRLVIDKQITFTDISRIDGLSGKDLFIKLASFRRNAYFQIARNLMRDRRDMVYKMATGDKNNRKHVDFSDQIYRLDGDIAEALSKTWATPKECGVNSDNLDPYKWNAGKAYLNPGIGPKAFSLDPHAKLQGSVEYFEKSLWSLFPHESQHVVINKAFQEYLSAPAPVSTPLEPPAAPAPVKGEPVQPAPENEKKPHKGGWPKGRKRGPYKKKTTLVNPAPDTVPEPEEYVPDFVLVMPAVVLDPNVARARTLYSSLETAKDPKAAFAELVGLIDDKKVQLKDIVEKDNNPDDKIKILISEHYLNGLLRVSRDLLKQRKKIGVGSAGYRKANEAFTDSLVDICKAGLNSENILKVLVTNKRLEGSVLLYETYKSAVSSSRKTASVPCDARAATPEKPLLLGLPSQERYRSVQVYSGLNVTYVMTRDEITDNGFVTVEAKKLPKPKIFKLPKLKKTKPAKTTPEKTKPVKSISNEPKRRGRPVAAWKALLTKEGVKKLLSGPVNEGTVTVVPPENKSPMEIHREMLAKSNTRARVVFESVP